MLTQDKIEIESVGVRCGHDERLAEEGILQFEGREGPGDPAQGVLRVRHHLQEGDVVGNNRGDR